MLLTGVKYHVCAETAESVLPLLHKAVFYFLGHYSYLLHLDEKVTPLAYSMTKNSCSFRQVPHIFISHTVSSNRTAACTSSCSQSFFLHRMY
jgi:hypothetical protein